MRILAIALLCCFCLEMRADLDQSLLKEIKTWKKGERPPARLLKFPDGKIDLIGRCGLRVWGNEVRDYLDTVKNPDLLAAILFDLQAEPESIHAAAIQLLSLKGVRYVSGLLEAKQKEQPPLFRGRELAVLAQLLRSPYLSLKVARISRDDMEPAKAEGVLKTMKTELDKGAAWAKAYQKFSELHPDLRDRAQNPKSVRTLICYLYDSIVSPSGFDLLTYSTAENLPSEHLREIFRRKSGTHVLNAPGGVYLYYLNGFFEGHLEPSGM